MIDFGKKLSSPTTLGLDNIFGSTSNERNKK